MPTLIKGTVYAYIKVALMPYLFDLVLFVPAFFLASRQRLEADLGDNRHPTKASFAQLGSDPYDMLFTAGGHAQEGDGASTTILIERYSAHRLFASHDPVWSFCCCLCASYVVVRVFSS
ncbi:hypothetical protein ABL78_7394 [Leptomonas seymouri]|uniref:Uncharacterized protein n=1 Tax=Leptomonas seymouri TaxID=5684 RepID=A0A0N1IHZ8_LEPSE|nr:hypothetical protein ABL78_7394 [Leptomonas seymouri]|eukprot:KPI83571.1 hypothetical protein ABL78_7394 [Leptomonas seymouri]